MKRGTSGREKRERERERDVLPCHLRQLLSERRLILLHCFLRQSLTSVDLHRRHRRRHRGLGPGTSVHSIHSIHTHTLTHTCTGTHTHTRENLQNPHVCFFSLSLLTTVCTVCLSVSRRAYVCVPHLCKPLTTRIECANGPMNQMIAPMNGPIMDQMNGPMDRMRAEI